MHPFQKSSIILRSNLTDLCRPLGFCGAPVVLFWGGTFQILSTFPEFVAHSIIFAFFLLTDIKRRTDDTLPAAGPPATFAS